MKKPSTQGNKKKQANEYCEEIRTFFISSFCMILVYRLLKTENSFLIRTMSLNFVCFNLQIEIQNNMHWEDVLIYTIVRFFPLTK